MARPGLTGHRKFRRLERTLGSRILARGALELLWESCYECGEEYVGTAADIEALVGWQGAPGELAKALAEAGQPEGHGFVEVVPSDGSTVSTYRVHDLWHHAPDYVAKRHKRELARRKRVAPSGKRRRSAPNGGQRPPSTDSLIGVDRTPAPSPSPSPAPVDQDQKKDTAALRRSVDAYGNHQPSPGCEIPTTLRNRESDAGTEADALRQRVEGADQGPARAVGIRQPESDRVSEGDVSSGAGIRDAARPPGNSGSGDLEATATATTTGRSTVGGAEAASERSGPDTRHLGEPQGLRRLREVVVRSSR